MKPLFCSCFAAFFCLVSPSVAAPPGLLHHWNFDEGPDWHDNVFQAVHSGTLASDSEGTAHATLQNMPASSWVSGRQFTGLAFNGTNQFLTIAGNLAPALGGSASLSFWIRTSQAGTASPSAAPGVTGAAAAGGVQWGWIDASGKIGLGLDGTSVVQSAVSIHDGKWHHVVLTRNATSGATQVYIDGVLSASASGPAGTRSLAFNSLGRIEGGGYFQGRLDQVTVFNRVIDASEVITQRDNHAPKTWNHTSDGVNDRPFTTPSVFSRAFDVERDEITVKSWTNPAIGSVAYNGDGSFTYTPVSGYVGTVSFDVTVEDGKGGYHRGTMTLRIITEPPGGTTLPVTQFTNFAAVQAAGVDISHTGMRVPRVIDWNNDGLKDILIGAGGYVWRYMNTGTASAPAFAAAVRVQANGTDIYAGTTSNNPITLVDMTGDGVRDLVMADSSSKLRIYRNTAAASATPVYAAHTFVKRANGTTDFVLPDKRFDIGDYNADGKPDLVTGSFSGNMLLYLNANTTASPRFEGSSVLFSDSYNIYPRFCDLGLNGQVDFVRGINWGNVQYWLNVPANGLAGTQYLTITDAAGVTPAFQSLTDGVIADFADFNGDGKTDILIGGHASNKIFLAYGVRKSIAESIAEIEAIYDANSAALGAALSANSNALLGQVNAANLNLVSHLRNGSLGTREAVFTALAAHINKYAFLKYQELNTTLYRHVPSIVLQNWVILHYLLPDTPARRVIVADIMGLTGTARQIYLENGLALGDNGKSVPAAYGTIRDFMRRHPREAFPDAILTFDQLYDDQRGGFVWTPNSTKNTFGQWALGNANEWAGDLTTAIENVLGPGSASGDYFTFVMGHEVVHSLDNYINTRANTDLRRRWGQRMVYAAGPDVVADANGWFSQSATQANFQTKGYYAPATQTWTQAWDAYWATGPGAAFNSLSSMRIDIKFFLAAPQESLATQANHHWANGPGRLIGALDRFRRAEAQGIEPMKANMTEAVDFIDFISSGMNRVNLVETKNQGGVVVYFDHFADLVRDDKGRITRITVDGRFYELVIAENGLVTQVLTEADYAPRAVDFETSSTRRVESDGSVQVTVRLDRPARYTPITVDVVDAGTGTATANSDYNLAPGTLTFADGEQSKTFTVNLLTDAVLETPEALVLALANPTGTELGSRALHSILLTDASAPQVATQQFSASSTMAAGTVIGTVSATSAPGRSITGWSIVAGNTGGVFGINNSGQISLLLPGALPTTPSTRQIVVRAMDSSGTAADGTLNIVCNAPAVSGVWERRWSGATAYNNQNWTGSTSYSGSLASFTTAQNVGDTYSRRLIGYIQPQVSGNYTFWLAADDLSRLYISTNATEANKTQIASVSTWTNFQSWDASTSQKSASIALVAGQVYWMEVHQYEGGGGDHASVAWSGPGFAREPIPASALFPSFGSPPFPASVVLTGPPAGGAYQSGDDVTITANVVAGSLAPSAVQFYRGPTLIATDNIAPYSVVWEDIPAGSHMLTARVVDAGGSVTSNALGIDVINTDPAADPDGDGFTTGLEILLGTNPQLAGSKPDASYANFRAWWKFDEISGSVADDSTGRVQDGVVTGATWSPGLTGNALDFNGSNQGVLMGTAPAILGTSDFTVSAWVKVDANSPGGTIIQQREPGAVGYQGEYMLNVNPDGTITFFVYGVSSYQFNLTSSMSIKDGRWHLVSGIRSGTTGIINVDGTAVATGSGTLQSLSPRAVSVGYDYRDANKYFDGLIDDVRIYERALSGQELDERHGQFVVNTPPVFSRNPIAGGNTNAAALFTTSLAGFASDPDAGDPLVFSKTGGPDWASVAANGILSGTPGTADAGINSITVRVTDAGGLFAEATFNLTIDLTPTQSWQVANFGADSNNPAIAGDLADPDGDGVENLIEYALGSNPKASEDINLTHDMVPISGTEYLRLNIQRNPAATDVSLLVETCADLSGWTHLHTFVESNTPGQLIVRDTGTGPSRYIRLKVSR
ncbi:MAG: cadherin-like domain-containing protein [Akkermansiaceae bacterium]|nr:cadherin-like domain-containing protein [Akkermansiaceae bacterium]